jgi:hypothetical protein
MRTGLRSFLHFQVFTFDTKSASGTNATTSTPTTTSAPTPTATITAKKEQKNEMKQMATTNKTSEVISKGDHLKIISSSWKLESTSLVQMNEWILSLLKLSRVAPPLNDTTYSSLTLRTDCMLPTKMNVPQIGVLLSSVDDINITSPVHYGYDRVVSSLFNKLIEIGIGKKISYQRILIDWHAQEELDYNCQGPDCSATILPFGSHQVQYLSTMAPPSPIENDEYLRQNRLHRRYDRKPTGLAATPTNRWKVPFFHFGDQLMPSEQAMWEELWFVKGHIRFNSDQSFGGERGGYMCNAAILTMKSISELIFESLPSTIIMLAPLIVDMLPTWERWNKQTISCHDTLPTTLCGGETFSSFLIIDPPPIDKDITIELSSDIQMTPNVFEFKRNGVTSIPFTINVPENQERTQTPLHWNMSTDMTTFLRYYDDGIEDNDEYEVIMGHKDEGGRNFYIQLDYQNTFIIHSPVAPLNHIILRDPLDYGYGHGNDEKAVLVSLSSFPLQLEMKITSLPLTNVTLSISCHSTQRHDDADEGNDDDDEEESGDGKNHDNKVKALKSKSDHEQQLELTVSPSELRFTNGGLLSLPFAINLPPDLKSSTSPSSSLSSSVTSSKVNGRSRQLVHLHFKVGGDGSGQYNEPEQMTLVIID